MKKTQELEKSDRWIVSSASLCALLLFIWLVYDIAFLNPELKGQIAIGKIAEVQNSVKRKFGKSLIWYVAENQEVVYENDWIFTGSQSIAKIKLDSGGEIVVEPDSLIVLSRKNGVLELNLQHGRLLADIKKEDIKINVVQEGEAREVDTTKGPIRIDQKELKAPVDILTLNEEDKEKNLSLSELANQSQLEKNEDEEAREIIDPKAHELTYSENNYFDDVLFAGQKTEIQLAWKDPKNKWERYQVEIAKDAEFTEVLRSLWVKRPVLNYKTEDSGDFKWRIRGVNSLGLHSYWTDPIDLNIDITWKGLSSPLSLSRFRSIYQMNYKELDAVNPDQSFNIDSKRTMKLNWEKQEGADHYDVEFSDNKEFSEVLWERVVKKNQVKLKQLRMGATHFRIVPKTKEGITMAEPSIGKIKTQFPPPKEKSLRTIDKKTYQVLKWEKVPEAKAYRVSYKDSKEAEAATIEYVKKNRLVVKNQTGYMQWKVHVADPETQEKAGADSVSVNWYDAARRLASLHASGEEGTLYPKITKPAPRKTFVSFNNSPLFIVMNWTYAKEAKSYVVEISNNEKMTDTVFKKKVTKKQKAIINRRFPAGVYYMRVRAVGDHISQDSWSEVEAFRVINRKVD